MQVKRHAADAKIVKKRVAYRASNIPKPNVQVVVDVTAQHKMLKC